MDECILNLGKGKARIAPIDGGAVFEVEIASITLQVKNPYGNVKKISGRGSITVPIEAALLKTDQGIMQIGKRERCFDLMLTDEDRKMLGGAAS